ncbi:hypothetical protein ACFYSH_03890 [Streptomyces sp. NPDC005791]|uniref:hypothetical protein n=1 Tax=Streptomyces sp. NPDC005791 TaxID=3364732 RepID=UPI0036AA1748
MHAKDPSRTTPRQVPAPVTADRPRNNRPDQHATGLPGTLAHLQRSAGNSAVTRALTRATTVQRYAQGPDAHGFDKVSANGLIALRDRRTAYADAALIQRAAAELDAQERVAITLEPGDTVTVGDRTLHQVLPVYKSEDRARSSVTAAGQDAGDAAFEPVRGDTAEMRTGKRDAYLQHVGRAPKLAPIVMLTEEIHKAEGKGAGAASLVNDLYGRANGLANSVMGGGWLLQQFSDSTFPTGQTLASAKELLKRVSADYLNGLNSVEAREAEVETLMISIPNDCQGTAQQLIGRPPGGLGTVRDNPAVGENHYINLSNRQGGAWQNHFAAVLLRDGADSLSYETAADSYANMQWGKSLGYFALYGAAGTEQSFAHVIGQENAARGAERAHAE